MGRGGRQPPPAPMTWRPESLGAPQICMPALPVPAWPAANGPRDSPLALSGPSLLCQSPHSSLWSGSHRGISWEDEMQFVCSWLSEGSRSL